jgi:phosphoesterase RecJ-like protein
MTWAKLRDLAEGNHRFLISSHVNPDGDSIGSQLAFYWYLRSLGKEVTVYDRDPVPTKLAFLADANVITTRPPAGPFDVFVVLDSSNPRRLGWKGVDTVAPRVINIDHHRDNTLFGDCTIVDTDAAATGELIHDFFIDQAIDFPPPVAEALYTAIMTDTGGFRFANTNGRVLRVCAELADRGADCARAHRHVYASHSPNGLLLRSRIWSTLRFHFDTRLCTMELPVAAIDELGASYGDAEGMADMTVTAVGTEVGMLMKYTDTETHFSLRSNGKVDVGRIARDVGGGGHECAAGCTMHLALDTARRRMLEIIGGVTGWR